MTSSTRKPYRGYLYIAAAALLWGISASLGRAAFTGRLLPHAELLRPIDPLILSQSRTTFSFLVLLAFFILRARFRTLRVPAADFGRLLLLGILGVAASNYFYYLAIQKTNVATAIVLQYTAPVWVLIYAVLRGQQKPTAKRVGAVALAVAGIAMVIEIFGSAQFRLDKIGVIAALLAAFSFTFYNVGGHSILARYDRWTVLLYTTLSASLFWFVVNSPAKVIAAHYSGAQWMFLFIFSLLSVLGPFSLYFAGLQHLEPTRAVIASCLEPVFSIVIAAFTLGEILLPAQAIGIGMVLAAIMVVQLPDRAQGRSIPPLEPIE